MSALPRNNTYTVEQSNKSLLIVELWIGSFNKREDILGLAHKNLSLTTTAFPPFVTNFVWVFEFVSISVGWLPDWAG